MTAVRNHHLVALFSQFLLFAISIFLFVIPIYLLWSHITHEQHHLSNYKPHVVALILARGGSKGIPKKNLAIIQNSTLLRRSLNTVNDCELFHDVWVSTDDKEIATEAKLAGAKVFHRSAEMASDEASSLSAVKEFSMYHPKVDIFAIIQCTSPFLTVEYLTRGYRMAVYQQFESVFSVTRSHKLRWKLDSEGQLQPANFDVIKRPRRQDWNGEYVENGMFYFVHKNLIVNNKLQGGKLGVVVIPMNRSLEIDTYFDLQAARLLASLLDMPKNLTTEKN
ncbi:Nucleotide-diphospho-sugar transferases,Acylneuraminate cytidylyltransferase [Cinara cedri]|uniref:Nucleotide-diphospho-sugar transferases,Acylneuraminate cytidylyltransferase n=1 Tax=Cinara cedri TaxID=506608 RepID=A0A5E4NAQ6_9HEMI|nr:Nucleotide-diphospho-sugar transferases,Acylneuraminate cytidylyltransferase [Cinara cedri]